MHTVLGHCRILFMHSDPSVLSSSEKKSSKISSDFK